MGPDIKTRYVYTYVKVEPMSPPPTTHWTDYILSLSMELAFGDGLIDTQRVFDRIGLGINGD
jgi:hypothetical protein